MADLFNSRRRKKSQPSEDDLIEPKLSPDSLGFGKQVTGRLNQRLLNRDGSFNVSRRGLSQIDEFSLYHALITMSWVRFLGISLFAFMLLNAVFALSFFVLGAESFTTSQAGGWGLFWDAFFLSAQSFTTVGYGGLSPLSTEANFLASFVSFSGLFAFALATGLLFARFSLPTIDLLFSQHALISPYKEGKSLQFRLVNKRRRQLLIDLEVSVSLILRKPGMPRSIHTLEIVTPKILFFPLSWTVVHQLDEKSPLFGMTKAEFYDADIELMIFIKGVDDTFMQPVHVRTSYLGSEVIWNASFEAMFTVLSEGMVDIDLSCLDKHKTL